MAVRVICCPDAYPHYGEQRVRDFLVEKLDRKGRSELLVGCCLPSIPNALELNLTLVNRQGVFLIEVKDLFGPIRAHRHRWERSDGSTQPNPVRSVEHKASLLRSHLVGHSREWSRVNVTGLVVLASDNDQLSGYRRRTYQLDNHLIEALADGGDLVRAGDITLSQSAIEEVGKVLYDAHPAGQTRSVAGYSVVSATDRGSFVDLVARDPEFENRRVRIKQYDVLAVSSWEQIEEARLMFKRDMAALLEAGPHPHLLIPHRFVRDPNSDRRCYLVIEWVDGLPLSKRIKAGPIPLPDQYSILKAVSEALIHCHSQHVIHRNLTPEAIYLTADDQVKVGDFDFAKMPSVTRPQPGTDTPTIDSLYASPEVLFSFHDVDPRADIYSLGAVWYDMLIGLSPENPVQSARIEETALPAQAKKVLRAMLQDYRDERPDSVAEVRRALEQISPEVPCVDLCFLIAQGESETLEFKEAACYDSHREEKSKRMMDNVVQGVAAFLNSDQGGTLLIGVSDEGEIVGLDGDYRVADPRKQNQDGYELCLRNALRDRLGTDCISFYDIRFHTFEGHEVCEIRIRPASDWVFVGDEFFVRRGRAKLRLSLPQTVHYTESHPRGQQTGVGG